MMIPNTFFGALYLCSRSPLRGVLTLTEKMARAKEGGGGEREREGLRRQSGKASRKGSAGPLPTGQEHTGEDANRDVGEKQDLPVRPVLGRCERDLELGDVGRLGLREQPVIVGEGPLHGEDVVFKETASVMTFDAKDDSLTLDITNVRHHLTADNTPVPTADLLGTSLQPANDLAFWDKQPTKTRDEPPRGRHPFEHLDPVERMLPLISQVRVELASSLAASPPLGRV